MSSLQEAADALGLAPDLLDLDTLGRVSAPFMATGKLVPPLLTREEVDLRSRLHPLDVIIGRELHHLQEVCHRPRLYLRIEEERVPVARARRASHRATATLLSHPEDWEHCTPREIRPQRVLALQADDEWDLYENRVAVRLVDNLLRYVAHRLDELRRLEWMARSGTYLREAGGSWRRTNRLFTLWAELFDDSKAGRQIDTTLRDMEALYGRILGLLESPLYVRIPRSAHVAPHLHSTNILANDAHYRHVASMWRAWLDNVWKRPLTGEELGRERLIQRSNLGGFARLLATRAVEGRGTCSVIDDVLTIQLGNITLRFRLLVARVPRELNRAQSLWESIAASGDHVLLVGAPEDAWGRGEEGGREEKGLPEDLARRLTGWDHPRVLPVSPWSIDSTERLARVIEMEAARACAVTWPSTVKVASTAGVPEHPGMPRWGTTVAWTEPGSSGAADEILRKIHSTREQWAREDAANRAAHRPVPMNRDQALRQVEALVNVVGPDTRCPACGEEGRYEARNGDKRPEESTWWCRCACGAEWGLRRCECGERFPAYVPYRRDVGAAEVLTPAAMERLFGREVQAEPCWRGDQVDAFRCRKCGRCSGGRCGRCPPSPAWKTSN